MRSLRHIPRYAAPSRLRPQPTIPAFIASSVGPPRADLRGRSATERMASDFLDRESVTVDDLKALGWTKPQIDTIADAARTRAQQLAALS